MKDSIYTIPISEVFEPKSGCPLCSLHSALDERWTDYITGPAMMESDVRIETNRLGFCHRHYGMTLTRKNRLAVALMLQSRLEHIDDELKENIQKWGFAHSRGSGSFSRALIPWPFRNKKAGRNGPSGPSEIPEKRGRRQGRGCFVCSRVDAESMRVARNIASLWSRDADFRALYSSQEFICHEHTGLLLSAARRELAGERLNMFCTATAGLTRKRLLDVKANIDAFCNLFDYRSDRSQPGEEVAGAVENAIEYLNGKL